MLTAVSQGCADVGVCYRAAGAEGGTALAVCRRCPRRCRRAGASCGWRGCLRAPQRRRCSPRTTLIAELFHGGFWLLIASFFGFGLLLAFTPCVLPMMPILSGIIVGARPAPDARCTALLLSAAYVLGMAITYALAGVAAGLSGAHAVGGAAESVGARRVSRRSSWRWRCRCSASTNCSCRVALQIAAGRSPAAGCTAGISPACSRWACCRR